MSKSKQGSQLSLPKQIVRWLEAVLPEDRDDVIGDLEEVHLRRIARWGKLGATAQSALTAVWIAAAFAVIRWRENGLRYRFVSKLEFVLALRLLRKQPVLSGTAVLSLAAGIAVAAIGFTMIDQMVNGALPVPNGERYVRLDVRTDRGERSSLTADHFRLLAAGTPSRLRTLEHVGAISSGRRNVQSARGGSETAVVAEVTPASLRLLDQRPLLGRLLTDADAAMGAEAVVLVRESLWKRRYGGEQSVLGERLEIAGVAAEIVGVVPDAFEFPSGSELWRPLSLGAQGATPPRPVSLFGILRPSATLSQASVEVTSVAALVDIPAASQEGTAGNLSVEVVPFTAPPGPMGVMAIVGLVVPMLVVLVIALNVANLIHARTASRAGELGLRTALGAPRARLVGQLSLEAGVMGAVAAALGAVAAIVCLRQIDAAITEVPFWVDLTAGPHTVGYAAGLAVVIALVCGALPALRVTRRSPGRALAVRANAFDVSRFGAALMVTQMALAVALLSGALVMARGLWSSAGGDLELPDQRVLTAQVVTPETLNPLASPAPDRVARAIEQVPGVVASGTADHLPRYDAPALVIEIESTSGEAPLRGQATRATVSPGFLESLEPRRVTGRLFSDSDTTETAARVAVVNEPFVERFFGGGNPIGARFRAVASGGAAARNENDLEAANAREWREIVGVVPDLGLGGGVEEYAAGFYTPGFTSRRYFYLSMLGAGDAESLAAGLRAAVLDLDPELVLTRIQNLGSVNSEERSFQAGFGATLSAVGGLALVLSLVGLYAMISLTVTQRRREIGVRRALGASRSDVVISVLRRAGINLVLGALFGVGLGWAFIRLQDQQLAARLPASEPWILPAVLMAFAVAGVAACLVPAHRAQRIAPSEALKAD